MANNRRRQGEIDTVQQQDVSTYGLTAANQQLAELGTPIPILFGKRTKEGTGGFVHTPLMIYQRMHSAGEYEWTRLGFVCGEGGVRLKEPAERGIRLGTDLIKSKQSSFYDLRFTDGATDDNDVNIANTSFFGSWTDIYSTITDKDDFFTIQRGLKQTRGLSQSFDPNQNFGLAGEPPDCETSTDPEFETSFPYPRGKSTHIEYNQINASIANTRKCLVTEFGFRVNLPQPSLSGLDAEIPVGSIWEYEQGSVNAIRSFLVTGLLSTINQTPLITSYASPPQAGGVWPSKTRVQIVSQDIAFYTVYRKFYPGNSSYTPLEPEQIAEAYSDFLNRYGNSVFFITLDDMPSFIWTENRDSFLSFNPDAINGYWERQDGQFDPSVFNPADPCEVQLTSDMLKNTLVPKLFCKIFYRKISSTSNNWEPLFENPFCFVNPNQSEIFASLKVIHPANAEEAFEYKFKPLLPVQADEFNGADFVNNEVIIEYTVGTKIRTGKYGVKSTSGNKVAVLFPGTQDIFQLTGNDGFEIICEGFYETVTTEVQQNNQVPNYDVGISYVNECVRDVSTDYPFMSMGSLTLRAGKGVSSADQLSFYYNDGAEIEKTDGSTGASNLFADLCYHALTYYPGSQGPITRNQIDIESFIAANKFCKSRKLFYDGVLYSSNGIHEFIAEHAKFFLHRFGMNQGKYTLFPALVDSKTKVDTATANQVVTTDILDASSFAIDYATLIDRDAAFLTIIWRLQEKNMPGIRETVTVKPRGYKGSNKLSYDLSGFCTSKDHAIAVARYLLFARMQQDQVVTFTCSKSSVDLTPGRLFRFALSVENSIGATYTNNDQYQVTSTVYRSDGLLDIRAVLMPPGLSGSVFDPNTYPEVE